VAVHRVAESDAGRQARISACFAAARSVSRAGTKEAVPHDARRVAVQGAAQRAEPGEHAAGRRGPRGCRDPDRKRGGGELVLGEQDERGIEGADPGDGGGQRRPPLPQPPRDRAIVLVTGLRADALGRLGYGDAALTALNPALVIASHNAYGWDGPWRDRRGFDSLVQMSCGIAAAGGGDRPVPLPVQALDHATGYLLAAAVGRALTARLTRGVASRVLASLTGTANLLWSLPRPADLGDMPPMPRREEFKLADARTAWGPVRRAPVPGEIDGAAAELRLEAGPLGRHEPAW
jgi:hypothetical protein